DALLSTVQMPPGVPVATVAVDGAKNAAMLAARILALKFPEINDALDAAAKRERARYDQTADEALAKLKGK
ncbi:MAG TPA: AIR carboxylase family protein, partial [Gallionella sp.]